LTAIQIELGKISNEFGRQNYAYEQMSSRVRGMYVELHKMNKALHEVLDRLDDLQPQNSGNDDEMTDDHSAAPAPVITIDDDSEISESEPPPVHVAMPAPVPVAMPAPIPVAMPVPVPVAMPAPVDSPMPALIVTGKADESHDAEPADLAAPVPINSALSTPVAALPMSEVAAMPIPMATSVPASPAVPAPSLPFDFDLSAAPVEPAAPADADRAMLVSAAVPDPISAAPIEPAAPADADRAIVSVAVPEIESAAPMETAAPADADPDMLVSVAVPDTDGMYFVSPPLLFLMFLPFAPQFFVLTPP
jgi:hypothetical protein